MEAIPIRKCLFLLIFLGVLASPIYTQVDNKKIKLATLLQPPMVTKDEKTGEYSGIMIQLLRHIGYLPDVKTFDNSTYGMEDKPQKLKDVLEDVAHGNSDLAIVALDSENRKSLGVTFTQPIFNMGFIVLYKIPEEWNPSYTAMMTLIEPFSPGLWCLILLMCVLASGVLFLLRWLSPFEARTPQESTTPVRSNSFMYMFASLWGQSSTDTPRSFSARLLTCVWWVFSLMTAGAYIGGLLAVLLRMNPHINTLPFGNMNELLRQQEVDVLVVRDGATNRFITQHRFFNNSVIWRQWTRYLEKYMVPNTDTAMTKMMQSDGKFVVYMSEITANYLANSLPCDKMVVAEPLGDLFYGFACKKNSKLCEELDQAIILERENGKIGKLMRKWTRRGGCNRDSGYFYRGQAYIDTFGVGDPNWLSPMTLTIKRFSGAFVMLMIGIGAAFLVLFAEIFYIRWKGQPFSFEGGHKHNDGQRITPTGFSLNQDVTH